MHGAVTPAVALFWIAQPEFKAIMPTVFPNGILLNSGLNGQHRGYDAPIVGYKANSCSNLWGMMAKTAIHEISVSERYPFMWVDPSGSACWLPTRHGRRPKKRTDFGSIPTFLRWKFAPNQCLGFLHHDGGYDEKGLWAYEPVANANVEYAPKPVFIPRSREWMDSSLRTMYRCQWGSSYRPWMDSNQIYWGVWFGGRFVWNQTAEAKEARVTPKVREKEQNHGS